MLVSSFLYSLIPSLPILSFIAYSCLLLLLSITHSSSLHHQNLSFLHYLFMETVEFKVDMVGIHEKRLRKCLSKLKGIEKVEVDGSSQKVVVTGYAHKNKILKAMRRSGLKAEFWSAQNEILLNAYASGSWNNNGNSLFSRFNNFNFF